LPLAADADRDSRLSVQVDTGEAGISSLLADHVPTEHPSEQRSAARIDQGIVRSWRRRRGGPLAAPRAFVEASAQEDSAVEEESPQLQTGLAARAGTIVQEPADQDRARRIDRALRARVRKRAVRERHQQEPKINEDVLER